jgi:hypothetical protein
VGEGDAETGLALGRIGLVSVGIVGDDGENEFDMLKGLAELAEVLVDSL